MKKKLLSLTLPVGLLVAAVYFIGNRFFVKFPDYAAYPMLVICIGLILTGIINAGHGVGKYGKR